MDKDNMTAQEVSEYEIRKAVDEFFEAEEMGMELDEYREYVKKKEQEQKKD